MPRISQGGSLFSSYLLSSCCESICTVRVWLPCSPSCFCANISTSWSASPTTQYFLLTPAEPGLAALVPPSLPSLPAHPSRLDTVSCRPPCCLTTSACLASVWPTDSHSHHPCFTCAFSYHAFYNRIKIQISADGSLKTTFRFKGKSVSRLGR